ncbi:MAG: hypothetical protein HC913_14410 [Microscillaceae bacterium]|nr:hypothetical protein [Microscillaceae bacterium]
MRFFPVFLLFILFFACSPSENTTEEKNDTTKNAENGSEATEESTTSDENTLLDSPYLISKGTFFGVNIGDNLDALKKDKPDSFREDVVETGEGSFDVVKILDENGDALADIHFQSEENNVNLVEIYSEKAFTIDGLKIGKSFKDILKIYPDALPHGSEIEGQVNVEADGIYYRLDERNTSYDIDLESFNKDAKITAIILQ